MASELVAIGPQGILQAGTMAVANLTPGQSATTLQLQTILGNRQQRFPKVRTWRTIH